MLEERWRSDRSPRVFLQLADELRRVSRSGRAVEVLRDGLAWHPESVSGWVALGRLLLDEGDTEGAIEALDAALERDPAQLVASRLLTEAWIRAGDPDRAAASLERSRLLSLPDADYESLNEQIREFSAGAREAGPPSDPAVDPAGRAAEPFDLAAPRELPAIDLARIGRGRRGWVRVEVGAEPFAGLLTARADGPRRLERALGAEGIFPVTDGAVEQHAAQREEAAGPAAGVEAEARTAPEPAAVPAIPPPSVAAETAPAAQLVEMPREPVFEPLSIGEEVERETRDEAPPAAAEGFQDAPAARVAAEAPQETAPAATSTLAALYLAQGHLDEAEREYRRVLAERPDDAEAHAGLRSVERRRHPEPALAAAEPAAQPAGLTGRKLLRLRHFHESLRTRRREAEARVS